MNFKTSIQYEWLRPNVKARQKETIIKYHIYICECSSVAMLGAIMT